jgi:hypothetical protein
MRVGAKPDFKVKCVSLHRLIAKRDINGIPLAEPASNEYLDVTLPSAHTGGLQDDVLSMSNFVDRRSTMFRRDCRYLD